MNGQNTNKFTCIMAITIIYYKSTNKYLKHFDWITIIIQNTIKLTNKQVGTNKSNLPILYIIFILYITLTLQNLQFEFENQKWSLFLHADNLKKYIH